MDRLICSPCAAQWKLKRLLAFLALAFLFAIATGCGGGHTNPTAASDFTVDDPAVDLPPPGDLDPLPSPPPGLGRRTRGGIALLSWIPPTTNNDGSPVSLAGFIIYVGTSPGHLQPVLIGSAIRPVTFVTHLAPGTYFFAVTALSTTGAESAFSNIESKTITSNNDFDNSP